MGLLPSQIFFSLIMLISGCFYLSKSQDCGGSHVQNTVIVDQGGKGDFVTIKAAIFAIKKYNNQWFKIHINPGIYYEKINIPRSKSCLIFEGSGSNTTTIISGYPERLKSRWNPTFGSFSSNVIVSGITFENSYNLGRESKPIKQALAAAFYGNKSAIFNCRFLSYQDTLFVASGRHYFKDCYIQGEVDFIFGAGQSYFENCIVNATQRKSHASGYVTAQRRKSANDTNGFVFRKGSVVGNGKVYLGRPWEGPYPRVIFWGTYFSSVVSPRGWNAGKYSNQVKQFTYVEVNCTGPGANNEERVPWMRKNLNSLELNEYSLSSFINNDGWLAKIPNIFM